MAQVQAVMNDLPRFGIEIPTLVSPGGSDSSLDGLQEEKAKLENISLLPRSKLAHHHHHASSSLKSINDTKYGRLNKFVRRLHEMLSTEQDGGVVEWRRGLLVLHSIDTFSKEVLPKYFNTRNFKTFRRQLNYYGFLHVRSFSASSSSTTALWVNQELADHGSDCISSVLRLKRVEPNEASKTPEGRRVRKTEAASSVQVEGLGALLAGYVDIMAENNVNMNQSSGNEIATGVPMNMNSSGGGVIPMKPVPMFVHCKQQGPASSISSTSPSSHTEFAPRQEQETATASCRYNTSYNASYEQYEHHPVTPVTRPALPKMECTTFTTTQYYERNDPLIGQAAGLLLSLSNAS